MINIEYIQNVINEVSSCDTNIVINYETTIFDLGLDSLEILQLINIIEKDFSIEIKVTLLTPSTTIKDVINFVNKHNED